jgi:hypothetical protein
MLLYADRDFLIRQDFFIVLKSCRGLCHRVPPFRCSYCSPSHNPANRPAGLSFYRYESVFGYYLNPYGFSKVRVVAAPYGFCRKPAKVTLRFRNFVHIDKVQKVNPANMGAPILKILFSKCRKILHMERNGARISPRYEKVLKE